MTLQNELERMRPEIRTDSYSMSIGEWINLYENGELDIHPEFQRFYRWSDSQKTRFIESILLGIPIPPIFVAQREDGFWDVIDGLQRLSTIYQFVGILEDEEGNRVDPLVLERAKYLPSLEGKKWSLEDDSENSLTMAQRLYIKRAKFHVSIILRESDRFAVYELFQRLNTGGSQLSDQEIRNCILVQLNRDMYSWMRDLADYEPFKECTVLTDRALEEQYDLELILRFLVFRCLEEDMLSGIGDLGEFLTDHMVDMATRETFDPDEESEAFRRTFDILYENTRENSFRRYDPTRERFMGGFLVTPFEVFALGVGYNYSKVLGTDIELEDLVKDFWSEDQPDLKSGSGVRASTRIPTTIAFGRRLFDI